jgi:TolA-binding protein
MVNQTPENRLSPEEQYELEELRERLKETNTRIAELNRALVSVERELDAELEEARRLSYLIRRQEVAA